MRLVDGIQLNVAYHGVDSIVDTHCVHHRTCANGFTSLAHSLAGSKGARYGITSEGLIGLLFLPNGIGNFRTSMWFGWTSDPAYMDV